MTPECQSKEYSGEVQSCLWKLLKMSDFHMYICSDSFASYVKYVVHDVTLLVRCLYLFLLFTTVIMPFFESPELIDSAFSFRENESNLARGKKHRCTTA